MGLGSHLYRFVFLLHIVSSIVGFGAVTLNAFYGAEVKARKGREGLAILQANEKVSKIGSYFIYSVPLWGFGLVGLSDGVWELSQTWILAAIVLYVIAIGVSTGVMQPAVRRQEALMRELAEMGPPPAGASGPPPQVADLEANGKKIAIAGTLLNLMLLAILVDMIWRPGV
jgi:uncharacterized membrane protein